MWQLRGTSDKCPFCDARHLGLVLILHIEKLKDHVQNQVCDGSEESGGWGEEEEEGSLPYNALLNSAKLHAANCRELEKENTLLKLAINLKDGRLHENETTITELYKQLAALDHKVRDLENESATSSDIEDRDIYYDVDTFDYSEDDDCILGDYWQLSAFIERHVA